MYVSVQTPLQHPSINNTNIDTLLVAAEQSEKAQPPEELQDKIHFLFNNLSAVNLQEKVCKRRAFMLYTCTYAHVVHMYVRMHILYTCTYAHVVHMRTYAHVVHMYAQRYTYRVSFRRGRGGAFAPPL